MVNATVDNKPVSIQLDPGQSTTVPSNETWKVQITLALRDTTTNNDGAVQVNGTAFIAAFTGGNQQGQVAPNTTLVGNDTVSLSSAIGASIQGFVVDS
jgi:hypothetical protein